MPTHCLHNNGLFGLLIVCLSGLLCGCAPGPADSQEVAAKGLYSGAFDRNGNQYVIGSIHHGGSFWDDRGERLFNWNHQNQQNSVIVASAISPEGDWAITAESRSLVLWSTRSGKAVTYLATPAEVLSVALGANGNYALVGTTNNSALLYSLRQNAVVRELQHGNTVRSVAISDNGRYALTGSEDTTAVLWNLDNGRPLYSMQHSDDVQQVALSPDGRLALSAAQYDKAIIWRTDTGEIVRELALGAEQLKRGKRFTAARFNDLGNRLLTGRPDQTVELWDVDQGTRLNYWRLPKRNAWKPTGAAVIAVSFDPRNGVYHALAANGFKHRLSQ